MTTIPQMDGEEFEERINAATPAFVEQSGWWTKVQTDRGKLLFTRLAHAVPDWFYQRWAKLAVLLVGALLVGWLAVLAVTIPYGIYEALAYIANVDWLTVLQQEPKTPDYSLAEVLERAIQTAIELIQLYIFYLVLFLIFLPGIVFHEFGHFMAFIKNDADVESYGLIFIGPAPMGAFVDPGDEPQGIDARQFREIASAGIINNFAWGSLILAASLAYLYTSPTPIYALFYTPAAVTASASEVVAVLGVFFGVFEILMGASNAIPYSKLDGGHYARTLLIEWWNFGEGIRREVARG